MSAETTNGSTGCGSHAARREIHDTGAVHNTVDRRARCVDESVRWGWATGEFAVRVRSPRGGVSVGAAGSQVFLEEHHRWFVECARRAHGRRRIRVHERSIGPAPGGRILELHDHHSRGVVSHCDVRHRRPRKPTSGSQSSLTTATTVIELVLTAMRRVVTTWPYRTARCRLRRLARWRARLGYAHECSEVRRDPPDEVVDAGLEHAVCALRDDAAGSFSVATRSAVSSAWTVEQGPTQLGSCCGAAQYGDLG
jgi:hypothetical protein